MFACQKKALLSPGGKGRPGLSGKDRAHLGFHGKGERTERDSDGTQHFEGPRLLQQGWPPQESRQWGCLQGFSREEVKKRLDQELIQKTELTTNVILGETICPQSDL